MSRDALRQTSTASLARKLALVAVCMFGFGYALVPLYDVLCKITGQNQKPNEIAVAETEYKADLTREVVVEFVTSVNSSTPLDFQVEKKSLIVHPGKYYTINFSAKNNSASQLVAQAIPSITPGLTVDYFKKTQCFCFTEQVFAANETKIMPVRFVVKPDLPDRYKTITLAYTFFDNTEKSVKD